MRRWNRSAMARALGAALPAMALIALTPASADTPSTAPAATPPAPPALAIQQVAPEQPLLTAPIIMDRTTRMTLPVHIAGQGPYSFIVDTGSERTVVSRELAAHLGLASAGRARIVGIAEATMADLFHADGIELHSVPLGNLVVPAFAQNDIGGPGLIGIDSLAHAKLVLDFVAGTMDIRAASQTQRAREPEFDPSDTIVVTARRRAGRLILSDATIDGNRIDVVIDTGAQLSVGNIALQRLVRRHGMQSTLLPAGELTSVTGAVLAVRLGQISRISVGGVDFTDLPVAYADSPAFDELGLTRRPALLLGMDALRLFDRVAVDFPNRRVAFDLPGHATRYDARYALTVPPPAPHTGG